MTLKTNPFKAGDKVRVIKPSGASRHMLKGAEFTVDYVNGGYVYIKSPTSATSGGWDWDRFELVKPVKQLPFKPGDKVVLDLTGKYKSPAYGLDKDKVYEVEHVVERYSDDVRVWLKGSDNSQGVGYFLERFKLASSLPDTKNGFTIGQRVKVKDTSNYSHKRGKTGTVIAFSTYPWESILVKLDGADTYCHSGNGCSDRPVDTATDKWFFNPQELVEFGAPGTIPADVIEIGTFIIIVEENGKLAPAQSPRVLTSSKQAKAVALSMAEKHPGKKFRVFKAVATAETEEVKTVTHKAVFKDAA